MEDLHNYIRPRACYCSTPSGSEFGWNDMDSVDEKRVPELRVRLPVQGVSENLIAVFSEFSLKNCSIFSKCIHTQVPTVCLYSDISTEQ